MTAAHWGTAPGRLLLLCGAGLGAEPGAAVTLPGGTIPGLLLGARGAQRWLLVSGGTGGASSAGSLAGRERVPSALGQRASVTPCSVAQAAEGGVREETSVVQWGKN